MEGSRAYVTLTSEISNRYNNNDHNQNTNDNPCRTINVVQHDDQQPLQMEGGAGG
jgi:hypothetical protein